MRIYLKNNPAKFHPDPIKNHRAFGFFEECHSQEEEEEEEEPKHNIRYLARAFMSTCLYVAVNSMGPMNKGSIVVAVLQ